MSSTSQFRHQNIVFNDKKDRFYFYRASLYAKREKLGKKCILSGMICQLVLLISISSLHTTSYDRYFSSGKVQVCGATPAQVFCTLNVGVAFGEISLLAMGEGNKRTANIYSEWDDPITTKYKFH